MKHTITFLIALLLAPLVAIVCTQPGATPVNP